MDETMVAIDAVMNDENLVLKACGQHGVMCTVERKNKGYEGTKRHEAFRHSCTITTDDYDDANSATLSRWTLASLLAFCGARQALRDVQINKCVAIHLN